MKKKWVHRLPEINGEFVDVSRDKLTEALQLMWENQLDPQEVDYYLVGDWN